MSTRTPPRWRYIIAAVLGAWLALWLLGGDRDPEAQTPPVTSITVTITQYHGRDMESGIDFYRLSTNSETAILSVSHNLSLAKYMREHLGRQVLTLEAPNVR
jgi:hypothetical protein